MVTYLIRFTSNESVGWTGIQQVTEEFDFDHHEQQEDGTYIEVYVAQVDGDKTGLFERVLENHPNLISYERQ